MSLLYNAYRNCQSILTLLSCQTSYLRVVHPIQMKTVSKVVQIAKD